MVKQFLVVLMNGSGLKNFVVNCANEFSAKTIARAVNPLYRVIEVIEKSEDTIDKPLEI